MNQNSFAITSFVVLALGIFLSAFAITYWYNLQQRSHALPRDPIPYHVLAEFQGQCAEATRENTFYNLEDAFNNPDNVCYLILVNQQLTEIPETVSVFKNMVLLDISHNRLTQLPVSIGTLPNLQLLFANNNQLQSIPTEIQSLATLKSIALAANPMSTTTQQQLTQVLSARASFVTEF